MIILYQAGGKCTSKNDGGQGGIRTLKSQFLRLKRIPVPSPARKLVRKTGIEPATSSLATRCTTAVLLTHGASNRYRTDHLDLTKIALYRLSYGSKWWERAGSNRHSESHNLVCCRYTTVPVEWSTRTVLNRRPTLYERVALPAELRVRKVERQTGFEPACDSFAESGLTFQRHWRVV